MRRLSGDRRWWCPPHARVGLLLLEERIGRHGALRELALCTRELRIERRNLRGQSKEASNPSEGIRGSLLLLRRHARCWGSSRTWPSGAAGLSSAGRLVRVRRRVGLEDRATTRKANLLDPAA